MGRTEAILRPSKGPASQRILRVRSVFLGKMSVLCVLGFDWREKLGQSKVINNKMLMYTLI